LKIKKIPEKVLIFWKDNVILVPIMKTSILTYQFKQASSFAKAAEDRLFYKNPLLIYI